MHDMREVSIPVGPQHPALKEPESFLITLKGEDHNLSRGATRQEMLRAIARNPLHGLAQAVGATVDAERA